MIAAPLSIIGQRREANASLKPVGVSPRTSCAGFRDGQTDKGPNSNTKRGNYVLGRNQTGVKV